jgi:tight adherence protein C
MSEVYIPIALIGTFAAVMLAGIAVEITVSQRRKSIQVLEAQVGQLAANLRQEDLSRSFLERVLFPVAKGLGAAARRLTPIDMRKRLDHKLVLMGSPAGWDAERVAAFKLMGLGAGAFTAFSLAGLAGDITGGTVMMASLFAAIGYFAPDAVISGRVQRRQEAIRKALPDSMDLLTISVEAGLGFDAAMAQVVRNVPGPLSHELGRMLQEMQLGMSRDDAFRKLADRTSVEELRAFVISMIQANKFGVGVASVLRAQAKELRTKRKQRAERKAMQTPVKILFPLIFCVLPALFVVVMGPGAIRIFSSFFGTSP